MHSELHTAQIQRAAVVAGFEDAAYDKAHAARLEAYRFALMSHDWEHQYSDDQRVWRRGNEERKHLQAERAAIDADGAIWNLLCPAAHRVAA